jgi:hypothetical protein
MATSKEIKAALVKRFGRTFNVVHEKTRDGRTIFAIHAPSKRVSERGYGFRHDESVELAMALGLPEWAGADTFCFWDKIVGELIDNLSHETPVDLSANYRHPYGSKAPNPTTCNGCDRRLADCVCCNECGTNDPKKCTCDEAFAQMYSGIA